MTAATNRRGAEESSGWDAATTLRRVRLLERQRREHPQSVLDLNPQGAVTWTEAWAMMREDGYVGNVVDGRLDWSRSS